MMNATILIVVESMKHCSNTGWVRKFASARVAALALMAGCAATPQVTTEEIVGQRALDWADALIAQDFDRALTFMTPSYQASPRADRYRGTFSGAGFWSSVELKQVECDLGADAGRCEVRVIINMIRPPELTREMPIPYDTTWVLLGDEWYQYRD